MERIILQKLNKVEGKEQYHVEISNMFAALQNILIDLGKLLEGISKFQPKRV
jgi:hypothetical protein